MAFNQYDVVKVPFPFTERNSLKKRPAVIISTPEYQDYTGHCVLTMITTAKHSQWPTDITIENIEEAGLPVPSIIRLKIFSLDQRLILGKLGTLHKKDVETFYETLKKYLGIK